jgi:hypothetical protein
MQAIAASTTRLRVASLRAEAERTSAAAFDITAII